MLKVQGLHCSYGDAQVLHGVSLTLERGQVLALLGRNGAGKSTTLKGIAQLLNPDQGEVQFEGAMISGMEPYEVARLGVGYVPEDRRVFSTLSVLENLEVGRQNTREGAPTWTPARLFELFPNLGRMQKRPGGQMSGGEQQMLAIARTLMGNPKLLLLDEPSEGLAPVIVEQMIEAIDNLRNEGLSVLLCEQNLHFAAKLATHACVIEQGEVREECSMQTLMASDDIRERYLGI